ncbi:MAG: hypothetical protein ACPG6U_11460, partial [Paracoccaceae bacterium]
VFLAPLNVAVLLLTSCAFGAAVFSMYPVIVAHANDHAAPGMYIQISGGISYWSWVLALLSARRLRVWRCLIWVIKIYFW